MQFADSSAAELRALCSIPEVNYNIPLISQYFQKGIFHKSELFLISGSSQSYKTSLAAELMIPFINTENIDCNVVWIDADYKFPLDLLNSRNANLNKIKVAKCNSSEDVLFNLLSVEHEIQFPKESTSPIRAVVIDSLNSSFWIDVSSSKLSCRTRNQLNKLIENFVTNHGITMIVVLSDLGFDPKLPFEYAPMMRLVCSSVRPSEGQIAYGALAQNFKIRENRSFDWGKIHHVNDQNNKNDNDND